jgi:hypothetical protein
MIPSWLVGIWHPVRASDYADTAHITFSHDNVVIHEMGEVLFDRVWQLDSCEPGDVPDTLHISALLHGGFEDFDATITRTSPTTISCHFLGVDALPWTCDVELVFHSRS